MLTYEDMINYPVLNLRYIDVETTDQLVHYLLHGGFVLVNPHQLDWLERQMESRMPGLMRRIEVGSDHRLMSEPYSLPGYTAQGLEVKGRLAVITNNKNTTLYSPLLVNAVVYALTRPGTLAIRYQDQNAEAKYELSPAKRVSP